MHITALTVGEVEGGVGHQRRTCVFYFLDFSVSTSLQREVLTYRTKNIK